MARRSFRLLAALAIGAACATGAPPARAIAPAAQPSESDQLIDRALDLREAGKDREALPLLERAARLDPSPRARAQLAFAHQALGDWVEAERGLLAALEARGDAWVAAHQAVLDEALATVRQQLGWLEVEADRPGAEVTLNGARIGVLPLPGPLRVPAGVSVLSVTAPGYSTVVRNVEISAEEHAREVLVLRPDAPAPPGPAAPVGAPPPDAPRAVAPSGRGSLSWIALGGAGAALAGGLAANVAREQAAVAWNLEAVAFNTQCDPRCPGARPSRTNVDVLTGLAIAGYAVTGALGASSLFLFLRPRSPSRADAAPRLRCGPGALSLWCEGAF